MGKFKINCIMSIITLVVICLLLMSNNYNFMSFILGMIIGGVSGILGCSTKD